LKIEIFDIRGRLIMKKNYSDYISRSLILDDFRDFERGIYFVRLGTPGRTFTHKVIKVNR